VYVNLPPHNISPPPPKKKDKFGLTPVVGRAALEAQAAGEQ